MGAICAYIDCERDTPGAKRAELRPRRLLRLEPARGAHASAWSHQVCLTSQGACGCLLTSRKCAHIALLCPFVRCVSHCAAEGPLTVLSRSVGWADTESGQL